MQGQNGVRAKRKKKDKKEREGEKRVKEKFEQEKLTLGILFGIHMRNSRHRSSDSSRHLEEAPIPTRVVACKVVMAREGAKTSEERPDGGGEMGE